MFTLQQKKIIDEIQKLFIQSSTIVKPDKNMLDLLDLEVENPKTRNPANDVGRYFDIQ